ASCPPAPRRLPGPRHGARASRAPGAAAGGRPRARGGPLARLGRARLAAGGGRGARGRPSRGVRAADLRPERRGRGLDRRGHRRLHGHGRRRPARCGRCRRARGRPPGARRATGGGVAAPAARPSRRGRAGDGVLLLQLRGGGRPARAGPPRGREGPRGRLGRPPRQRDAGDLRGLRRGPVLLHPRVPALSRDGPGVRDGRRGGRGVDREPARAGRLGRRGLLLARGARRRAARPRGAPGARAHLGGLRRPPGRPARGLRRDGRRVRRDGGVAARARRRARRAARRGPRGRLRARGARPRRPPDARGGGRGRPAPRAGAARPPARPRGPDPRGAGLAGAGGDV
ncbi:MAG: Acetylspermidine deacetylase; Deacetylases, including yeast histone deacetylase and acetoin utilization protein, partial [uncultured Solirubrobacteraceae bacterium]